MSFSVSYLDALNCSSIH